MPVIHVELLAGRTDEQLARYVAALTDLTCSHLGCSREGVVICIRDMPAARYATGGVLWSQRAHATTPTDDKR